MIRLIDNNKAVEISIRGWDEENSQYGPDQSADLTSITASDRPSTWRPGGETTAIASLSRG